MMDIREKVPRKCLFCGKTSQVYVYFGGPACECGSDLGRDYQCRNPADGCGIYRYEDAPDHLGICCGQYAECEFEYNLEEIKKIRDELDKWIKEREE